MLESLDTLAPFAVPLAARLGLVIGSFLNVVIYRTPAQAGFPLPEMPCSGQGMAEYPDCQLFDAWR